MVGHNHGFSIFLWFQLEVTASPKDQPPENWDPPVSEVGTDRFFEHGSNLNLKKKPKKSRESHETNLMTTSIFG